MSRSFTAALFAAAVLGAPVAALASEPAAPAYETEAAADAQTTQGASAEIGDPNRKICRKVEVTGYRLRKTRLCATAAEWETRKAEERQALTKTQVQRGLKRE